MIAAETVDLVTDRTVSAIITALGATLVGIAGLAGVIIPMYVKHRREDRRAREDERQKAAQDRAMLGNLQTMVTHVDKSVNNRQEPMRQQLDRIESTQGAIAERQSHHSRDLTGVHAEIGGVRDEIGVLHQADRRFLQSLSDMRAAVPAMIDEHCASHLHVPRRRDTTD